MQRPDEPKGKIELILGPMFSGKTTELMRRLRRHKVAKRACLVLTYTKDSRYDNDGTKMITHDQVRYDATSVVCLADAAETCRAFDVIGVDEGQFFTDVVPFCEAMANAGKQVIVSALDGTFQRKPFGTILELIPLAEDVAKLTAVCAVCYHSAAFSKRITRESEVEVIGGADKYFAVCRGCYLADRRPRLDHDLERALE